MRGVLLLLICLLNCCEASAQANQKRDGNKEAFDTECGAKCAYIILRELGHGPIKYTDFKKELGAPSKVGYSMLDIRDAIRKHGLHSECVSTDIESLRAIDPQVKIIARFRPGHYLLCNKFSSDHVTIHDPALGRSRCENYRFFSEWTGDCILVSSSEIKLDLEVRHGFSLAFWLGACLVFIGSIALVVKYRRNLSIAILVVSIPSLCSCDHKKVDVSEHKRGELLIEKGVFDFGHQRMSPATVVKRIAIKNPDNRPVYIKSVNVSCRCASARLTSPTLEANATEYIEVSLDCRSVGKRRSVCTVECSDGNEYEVTVLWDVGTDLVFTPPTLAPIELLPGEEKKLVVELTATSPELLESLHVAPENSQVNTCRIEGKVNGSTCTLTFAASPDSRRQSETGAFIFRDRDGETLAQLPYIYRINPTWEILQTELVVVEDDGAFKGQLVIESTESISSPICIEFLGKSTKPCTFVESTRDNTTIVDVAIDRKDFTPDGKIRIVSGSHEVLLPLLTP